MSNFIGNEGFDLSAFDCRDIIKNNIILLVDLDSFRGIKVMDINSEFPFDKYPDLLNVNLFILHSKEDIKLSIPQKFKKEIKYVLVSLNDQPNLHQKFKEIFSNPRLIKE